MYIAKCNLHNTWLSWAILPKFITTVLQMGILGYTLSDYWVRDQPTVYIIYILYNSHQ